MVPIAVELATAYVNLVPSAKGITAGLGKELSAPLARAGRDAGDRSSKEFTHRFSFGLKRIGQIASGVLIARGVRTGITAITHQFGDLITQARESAKVQRLTNQVLQSTGGIAGVSGKQVDALAQHLAALSGVDDEVIQSGENVLLTFTNIRNRVGKGNDIFNQATTAALNLSAALGQDMQSSIIQVGKALNDPIKGMTALRRVGVSFTQSQIDQVKVLVASGNILAAQKIILKEVGTEFGGAATAAADPLKRLQVIVGNFKETLGGALLPTINKVADALGGVLPGLATTFAPILSQLIGGFASALSTVGTILKPFVKQLAPLLGATFKALRPVLEPLATIVGDLGAEFLMIVKAVLPLLPAFGKLVAAVAPLTEELGFLFVQAVRTLVPLIVPLIGVITKIAKAFIGTADNAGPLVQVVQIIGQAFSTFGKLLLPIIPLIGELAADLVAGLAPVLPDLAKAFGQLFLALAPVVPELAKLAIVLIRDIGVPTIVALAQSFAVLATAITPLVASLARMRPLVVGLGLAFVGFKAISTFTTALSFSRAVIRAAAFDLNRLRTSLLAQKVAAAAAAIGTKLLAAAQWLLNIAMDANPVILIVAAIAALAVGIFIVYKKFKPFRDVVDAVGRALAGVFDFVKNNWKLLLGLLIAPFIVGPILIFKKFGPTLVKLLGKVPALLGKLGVLMMKGLLRGLIIGLATVAFLMIGIPILLVKYLLKADVLMLRKGVQIISALVRGFISALPSIASFFIGLPARIAGYIRGAGSFLISKGVQIVTGLITGFIKMEVAIAKFWIGVPGRIIAALGVVVNTLIPKGIELVFGFLVGVVRAFVGVVKFFVALPGRIVDTLVGLATALIPKGIEVIGGFILGIGQKFVDVINFFAGIGIQIIGALPDAANWLWHLGIDIMQGLWDGLKSKFTDVKNWFVEKGKQLVHLATHPWDALSPSRVMIELGKNIMDGLAVGLEKNVGHVRKSIGKVTAQMQADFGKTNLQFAPAHVSAFAASTPAAVGVNGANGRQPIVHIDKLYADGRDQVGKVIADQQRRQYLLSTL